MNESLLRTTRRATLTRIASELEARRDALDEQAHAVRLALKTEDEAIERSSDVVLAMYLVAPGAKDVAEVCNAFGWRLPGAKGPRMYGPKDIFDLIRGPADGLNPHLHSLALEKLEGRHDAQWGPSGRAWVSAVD